MNKYIDAEKLATIIEERKAQQDQWINRYHDPINQGISYELTEILGIITSLQQEQPEVELETEVEEWWQNWASPPRNEYAVFNKEEFINLARHFYELGLNARKED